jgi:hypothetical protein
VTLISIVSPRRVKAERKKVEMEKENEENEEL